MSALSTPLSSAREPRVKTRSRILLLLANFSSPSIRTRLIAVATKSDTPSAPTPISPTVASTTCFEKSRVTPIAPRAEGIRAMKDSGRRPPV